MTKREALAPLVLQSTSTALHRVFVALHYRTSDTEAAAVVAKLCRVLSEREAVEQALIRTRLHGGPVPVAELARKKRRLTAKARRLAPGVLATAERFDQQMATKRGH